MADKSVVPQILKFNGKNFIDLAHRFSNTFGDPTGSIAGKLGQSTTTKTCWQGMGEFCQNVEKVSPPMKHDQNPNASGNVEPIFGTSDLSTPTQPLREAPNSGENEHIGPDSQERTRQFLKNIGAGSTVSIIKILLQLALLPIMAHLLGPQEFGIYALAVPVMSFLSVIADGGLGLSLARDQTNSRAIWSTAFWVLVIAGFVLALVVVLCGFVVSHISGQPRVLPVMVILAMSFPFLTVSVLPVARLTRSGNLVLYSAADFASTVVGAITAVTLGYLGFGAISLAIQYVVGFFVRAVLLNAFAFERPTRHFEPSAIVDHLSSGGILMGGRVADLAFRFGENLLFSGIFGPAMLGAYNFANQVPRFMFEAFSNSSWSALYAHSINDSLDRSTIFFRKTVKFMTFVTFPAAALLTASSVDLLQYVLGPTWVQSGVFMQLLSMGFAISTSASMGTAILLSIHKNGLFLTSVIVLGVGRILAVASGLFLSPTHAVTLVSIAHIAYSVFLVFYLRRLAGLQLRDLFRDVYTLVFASLVSAVVCWCVLLAGDDIMTIVASFGASLLTFAVTLLIIDRETLFQDASFLASNLKRMRK